MFLVNKKRSIEGKTLSFHNRDLSWLSFNERLLLEAERDAVPLMERIKFLAIYSSNLDEFYRVRMPALMALKDLSGSSDNKKIKRIVTRINSTIRTQQRYFGDIIESQIIPALKSYNVNLVYNNVIPSDIQPLLKHYFINTIAAYIHIINISDRPDFFPENNKLYFALTVKDNKKREEIYLVNIPSDSLPRFVGLNHQGTQYFVFIDDIVRMNLATIFVNHEILSIHSFKITRNAELDLQDEFTGNLAKKIEKKISQRDFGLATRFLFEPGIPVATLRVLRDKLNLKGANFVPGGRYHNMKNLFDLPLTDPKFKYDHWPQIDFKISQDSLFDEINSRDLLFHTPYHHYNTVVRFFNEASIDISVKKIYVTLYRVANDSKIANALISAARNGKKVTVFVELKARFDEANNLKWAKRMKAAGVRIIESIPGLKVHAKIALVKRKIKKRVNLVGLLATGNFNENTAQYYTDHILMTSNNLILQEVEKLFLFLKKRKKPPTESALPFKHLIVGQFNLHSRFLELIDREIENSRKGLPASITIKFNNLEEKRLIAKLYEASLAGVRISLIVRSICCLVSDKKGLSENISVKRIVDRYLEHGRIFIFNNNNNPEIFLGSADWMNRNIYSRIEVCFPIYNTTLKDQILKIIELQMQDNTQAVWLDKNCKNIPMLAGKDFSPIRSQRLLGDMLLKEIV